MKSNYSVSELCEALVVSRSGYHDWDQRRPGPRAQADAALAPLITQAHATAGRLTALRASRPGCAHADIGVAG